MNMSMTMIMDDQEVQPSAKMHKQRTKISYLCFGFVGFLIGCQFSPISFSDSLAFISRRASLPPNNTSLPPNNTSLPPNNTSLPPNNTTDCQPPRDEIWEWQYYGRRNATRKRRASKRMLIALYSGFGSYSRLLELTAPVNKAYAKKWKHDLVILQGAAIRIAIEKGCEPPAHRATFNKIPLLQLALKHKDKYDQLLIVDTDAMVYDMKRDISTLLPDNHILAAQGVKMDGGFHTWDVNAGVTLWDLQNPLTSKLAREWSSRSIDGIQNDIHPSNDQFHLHRTLRDGNYSDYVHALKDEFSYGHGTVIRHYIRKSQHKGWDDPDILDNRENRIELAAKDVCERFEPVCKKIERTLYTD